MLHQQSGRLTNPQLCVNTRQGLRNRTRGLLWYEF